MSAAIASTRRLLLGTTALSGADMRRLARTGLIELEAAIDRMAERLIAARAGSDPDYADCCRDMLMRLLVQHPSPRSLELRRQPPGMARSTGPASDGDTRHSLPETQPGGVSARLAGGGLEMASP